MGYIGNQTSNSYTSLDKQTITGDGGASYTLDHAVANEQEIEVFVNNVRQEPSVAYTVSGTALTMTGNVESYDDFYVVFQGKAIQTTSHPEGQDLKARDGTFSGDVTADGSLGIGTTSPSAKLSVTGLAMNSASSGVELEGAWPWLKFKDTEINQDSWLQYVDGSNYIIKQIDYDDRNSAPSTVGTERLRFDTSGNILFGKTTTDANTQGGFMNQNGLIFLTRSGDTSFLLNRTTNNGYVAQFRRDNSNVGGISVTTSATSFVTSSDHRLKENAVDMTGAIARVKNLQPKRFNFIADDTDTLVDGFMAHETQTVVPEAVTGTHNEVDADGNAVYQGIDQAKLVPLLTCALQEAIAKIEALETRVQALEDA